MPPDELRELRQGDKAEIEKLRELRQKDQAEMKKLKAEKRMLEEKISELVRLAKPFMAELFSIPGSLQSDQMSAGNISLH